MKKKSIIAIIIAAVVVIGGGIAIAKYNSKSNTESGPLTITESNGQQVKLKEAPQRIVCLDQDAYNVINMLGGDSKVVGVSQMMSESGNAKGKTVAGTWQDPNVSKILELKANVVLAYANYTNPKAVKQLEDAGVEVIYINGDNIATLNTDVTAIGQLIGQPEKAAKFNKIADKYLNLVKERISKIPADKRVSAYIEEYQKDQTAGKGSASQSFLDAAGINNIAANEGQFATVNPSWILGKNPDMIIKLEADGMGVLGNNVTNPENAKKAYTELVSRPGYKDLKAVKNNNVHLMDSTLVLSDTNVIPGVLYAAKWAYPEQFKDINPANVMQEIQKDLGEPASKGLLEYSGN
ncbi:MAG: ABC transporter substrate-binding protein [Clostridium sp.]|uniref:ABC transporter substrate-binding protein n=1 Tax=Clostridium sp. TaxID=1506 RepID=UPI003F3CCEC2